MIAEVLPAQRGDEKTSAHRSRARVAQLTRKRRAKPARADGASDVLPSAGGSIARRPESRSLRLRDAMKSLHAGGGICRAPRDLAMAVLAIALVMALATKTVAATKAAAGAGEAEVRAIKAIADLPPELLRTLPEVLVLNRNRHCILKFI